MSISLFKVTYELILNFLKYFNYLNFNSNAKITEIV